MFVYSRNVLSGRSLSNLRLRSIKRTGVGKLLWREWVYGFVCYRLFVSLITYKFSFQDVYWNSYFRSQYIFYVLPVIYYESDIQNRNYYYFFLSFRFVLTFISGCWFAFHTSSPSFLYMFQNWHCFPPTCCHDMFWGTGIVIHRLNIWQGSCIDFEGENSNMSDVRI